MLISTASGPRSVDKGDVLRVSRSDNYGRWVSVVLYMRNGDEVAGMILAEVLAKFEAELAGKPPQAA